MASMALQPAVLEFMDMVRVAPDLRIEELVVGDRSSLVSSTVRDACRHHEGLMMMAIRTPAGDVLVPPRADTVLGQGDVIIAVGRAAALTALAQEAR
jgi:K+/H+ antiporter YhaU regulatory subunit KhtT